MSKEINNKYGSQTKENPREFTKEFTFDDRYVSINGATYIYRPWLVISLHNNLQSNE